MSFDGAEGASPTRSGTNYAWGPTTDRAADVLGQANNLVAGLTTLTGRLREGVGIEEGRAALTRLGEMRADMRRIGSHPDQLAEIGELQGRLRRALPPDTSKNAYAAGRPGLKGVVEGTRATGPKRR